MSTDWKSSPHSRQSQEISVEEARARAIEREREASERRCRCYRPVPSISSYLGFRPCRMCGFLIMNGRST